MRKKNEWKVISCIFLVVIILGCISTPLEEESGETIPVQIHRRGAEVVHTGDLIIRGDEKMVIEDTEYF
jgi:hypothetical protein